MNYIDPSGKTSREILNVLSDMYIAGWINEKQVATLLLLLNIGNVYFLEEPFIPYRYNKKCEQWREWYRSGDIWIEDVKLISERTIAIKMEDGEKRKSWNGQCQE